MSQSPGGNELRDAFYASGCTGVHNFEYKTFQAARATFGDMSNTAFQVGGFMADAVNNGNGTVTFTIHNDASLDSFLYHGFYVIPLPNRTTGPMRTIEQTFQWTENIDQCRCQQKK